MHLSQALTLTWYGGEAQAAKMQLPPTTRVLAGSLEYAAPSPLQMAYW
jgi:hypothetical protein